MSALPSRNAANAYAQVGMQTTVDAADPHRLISMLFEGAIKACRQAKIEMEAGNIPAKGQLIGKAMDIILVGLKAGLNMEAGSELALNLAALYDHMTHQLFLANAGNDPEKIQAVIDLLAGLKEAWDQVPGLLKNETAPAEAPKAPHEAVPASGPSAAPMSPAAPAGQAGRIAKLYGSV